MTRREWFIRDAPIVVFAMQVALVLRVIPAPWDLRATMAVAGIVSGAWIGVRLRDKWKERG